MPDQLPHAHLVIETIPGSGEFNMAMDAALLSLAIHRTESVVRLYRWNTPTVSLGYFQATSITNGRQNNPFVSLPVVRRLSGGGAILHHHEWTYSCILPPNHPARHNPSQLYQTVHLAIIDLLSRCNAPCKLRGDSSFINTLESSAPANEEHFLCFLRGNPNDIVHQRGPKVVGSAQRRRQGAILQHGSLLLRTSPHAPAVPGLLELSPSLDSALLDAELPRTIARAVASQWHLRTWTDQELELASQMRG
jgi:lipoate-protein ligase A